MKPLAKILATAVLMASVVAAFADATLTIGKPAPAIKVSKWVKGTPVEGFKKGNIYVVEFWATWCGPCKVSIPHLTEMAKKFKDKVTFIGVSAFESDQALVEPFVKSMGDKMDYNVAMDEQENATARAGFMSKNWMDAAEQGGIPTAFIVGKDSTIQWIGHPMMMEEVLDQVVADKFDSKAYAIKAAAEAAEQAKAEEAWTKSPVRTQITKIQKLMKAKSYDEALKEIDVLAAMDGTGLPVSPSGVATDLRLQTLLKKGDMDGYYAAANKAFDELKDGVNNENMLNTMAWNIVDPESKLPRKDFDFALKVAKQCVVLGNRKNAATLDTLAWAYFAKDDKANAIACEKEAIALTPADQQADFIATLKKFGG